MARIRRLILAAMLVTVAAFAAPAPAVASSTQMSVFEDGAVFLGLTVRDPDAALREAKALGADAVRVYISWRRATSAISGSSVLTMTWSNRWLFLAARIE